MYIVTALQECQAVNLAGEDVTLDTGGACYVRDSDVGYYLRHPAVFSVAAVTPIGLDGNGGLTANINLRTDTLTNLLALAGGVSEIGYDPATSALALFNGVEGEALPSYRNRCVAMFQHSIAGLSTDGSASVYTPIDFSSITVPVLNDGIWSSDAPSELVSPTGADIIRISGTLRFAASATGSTRAIRLEYFSSLTSAWVTTAVPLVNFYNEPGALGTPGIVHASFNFNFIPALSSTVAQKYRLSVAADDVVVVSSNVTLLAEFFSRT